MTVWALSTTRGQAALAFSIVTPFCMAVLYGRAGLLTAKNGGFRPRAVVRQTFRAALAAESGAASPGR
jgi:hypothetical protein